MISRIDPVSSHPHIHAITLRPRTRVPGVDVTRTPFPLSAVELHEVLERAHRAGPPAAVDFARALLAMDTFALHRDLGFASLAFYALRYFGCSYLETQRLLAVARALGFLRIARSYCESGRISFEKLASIVRVATPRTERGWVELAAAVSPAELEEHVERALRSGDLPEPRNPYELNFPGGYTWEPALRLYA